MTLEEAFQLSCYEELTALDAEKQVYLVKEKTSGGIFVKKRIPCSHPEIYQVLKEKKFDGIPKIMEIIPDGNFVILMEEYIHGSSLQTIFDRKGYPDEREVLSIWLKLCSILKNLHNFDPPIIHRDIKPSNIMKSTEDNIYLIDFNASRYYASGRQQDTELIGTADYAPPEQYGFGQTDCRSDIFSLGVTMNVLLTGCLPKEQISHGELGSIILKCTKLDPEQRYRSVEELEQDLRKCRHLMEEDDGSHEAGNRSHETIAFRRYVIPGFRTGKWWKMLIAVLGYSFIAYIFLTLDLEDSNGARMTGSRLWFERIWMLSDTLLFVFFNFNYLGVLEKRLKRFSNYPILYRIIQIASAMIGYILIVGIMVLVEELIW